MMDRMRNVFKSKDGFTLIELMVVLAVLGILAAVAIPRFNDMRGKANLVKAKSELKQVQTAMQLHEAENGEYPADQTAFAAALTEYLVDSDLAAYEPFTYSYDDTTKEFTVTTTVDETTFTITRNNITD